MDMPLRRAEAPQKRRLNNWVSKLVPKVLNVLVKCRIVSLNDEYWKDYYGIEFNTDTIIKEVFNKLSNRKEICSNLSYIMDFIECSVHRLSLVVNVYRIGTKTIYTLPTRWHWYIGGLRVVAYCNGLQIPQPLANALNKAYNTRFSDVYKMFTLDDTNKINHSNRLLNLYLPANSKRRFLEYTVNAPMERDLPKRITINLGEFDRLLNTNFINGDTLFDGWSMDYIIDSLAEIILVHMPQIIYLNEYYEILCRHLDERVRDYLGSGRLEGDKW